MPPQVVHVKNASKVAAALANDKCQKILEYLGKHVDATETKISKELRIPLSTVHYNMKTLVEARLVLNDEYTYSPKGKEVTHYRINKNPIIIVQEEEQLQILKAIVPAALVAAGIGVAYTMLRWPTQQNLYAAPMAAESAPAADAGTMMAKSIEIAPTQAIPQEMLAYFLAGIVSVLFLSLLVVMIMRWWNTRAK